MMPAANAVMSQNIGWRTPSRKAARATAVPRGQKSISNGKTRQKQSIVNWACKTAP